MPRRQLAVRGQPGAQLRGVHLIRTQGDPLLSIPMWMWLKIKRSEGQTAGLGPCFHLPGQAILEFRFFEPQPRASIANCSGKRETGGGEQISHESCSKPGPGEVPKTDEESNPRPKTDSWDYRLPTLIYPGLVAQASMARLRNAQRRELPIWEFPQRIPNEHFGFPPLQKSFQGRRSLIVQIQTSLQKRAARKVVPSALGRELTLQAGQLYLKAPNNSEEARVLPTILKQTRKLMALQRSKQLWVLRHSAKREATSSSLVVEAHAL